MSDISWDLKNLDSLKQYIFEELIGEHKNAEDINQAINTYAERFHEMKLKKIGCELPPISNLTIEFLEWTDKKMWTKSGSVNGNWQELEGWYNTPNPKTAKKLLSTEELYKLFLFERGASDV